MALVRVRKNSMEFNVGESYAEAQGLKVIDSPTHDSSGRPRRPTLTNDRPIKPRKSIDELAPEKGTQAPAADLAAEKAAPSADDITTPSKEN